MNYLKTLRTVIIFLSLPVVLAVMLQFQACDEVETPCDQRLVDINSDDTYWDVISVKRDGVDVTSEFDGMVLDILTVCGGNDNTYETKGYSPLSIWTSGTYEFRSTDPNSKTFTRIQDGEEIDVTYSVDSQDTDRVLTLTHTWKGSVTIIEPGRAQLVGSYEFRFQRRN